VGNTNLFDLSGRTALVTGGSRGLGLQIALALGGMGARVAITARKAQELDSAMQTLVAEGIEGVSVVSDLGNIGTIEPMVNKVLEQLEHVDILVNNAGTSWGGAAEQEPIDKWRKVIELNLTGAFALTQQIGIRTMIPRNYGRIINIASVAGIRGSMPYDMQAISYHTSKGGLVNFTRALAGEWGRFGINVNAICPGYIPTKMSAVTVDRIGTRIAAATPVGRLGEPQDVQGLAILLAGQGARHISGQIIALDGGKSATS
jgi:NAD(P)-dependent dehydrogenase (short-subunit alcohol dehydrogenase family)